MIVEPQIKKHGGHEDQLSQKLCGMDRFRINALQKILDTGQLSNENQQSAVNMLLIIAKISLKGATKRGKTDEAAYLQQLIKRY